MSTNTSDPQEPDDTRSDRISDTELIDDIRRVYELIDGPFYRRKYDDHGEYSGGTIARRFDGWVSALDTAGIQTTEVQENRGLSEDVTVAECDAMRALARDYPLGTINEFVPVLNGATIYRHVYGRCDHDGFVPALEREG